MNKDNIYFGTDLDAYIRQRAYDESYIIIIFCEKGNMTMDINGVQYQVTANDLTLCNPTSLQGHYTHDSRFQCGFVAVMSRSLNDVVYLSIRRDNRWWKKAQYLAEHPVLHLTKRQVELILTFRKLRNIYSEYETTPARMRTLEVISQACISEMLSWVEELLQSTDEEQHSFSQQEVIFRKFIELLTTTHGTRREVTWFADQLAITPKYLSAICRNISKESTISIITKITTQEIKHLILTTDLTAKEISTRLEFNNLSFFCKYVKHNLGMSVSQYRKQNR